MNARVMTGGSSLTQGKEGESIHVYLLILVIMITVKLLIINILWELVILINTKPTRRPGGVGGGTYSRHKVSIGNERLDISGHSPLSNNANAISSPTLTVVF